MKLSPNEFKQRLARENLALCFVGMSNIGKSYTAELIKRDCGFTHIELDALIQNALGLVDMGELTEWMGFPFHKDYHAHAQDYINMEDQLIDKYIHNISGNHILDITGSAIYCDGSTLNALKDACLIIHISAGAGSIKTLSKRFSSDPKPLIWGDGSEDLGPLTDMNSLLEAYPRLLEDREARYTSLADISLSSSLLSATQYSGEEILELIAAQLN